MDVIVVYCVNTVAMVAATKNTSLARDEKKSFVRKQTRCLIHNTDQPIKEVLLPHYYTWNIVSKILYDVEKSNSWILLLLF